jgi:DNA (cytosine-5)-methyltransferase 1
MKILDLFSGIGGFHLGLEQAGVDIEHVMFSEVDKYAISVYQNHFKDAEYVGSVTDVRGKRGQADIITFGSPCQDFSVAGRRAGMDGDRSSLITHAIRLITEIRPKFFIWENVKGTFSSNSGEDFWAIIQAFANIGGYRLEWQLLNTSWFLPQNRERLYLVGCLGDQCGREIFPLRESDGVFNSQEGGERKSRKRICSTIDSRYGALRNSGETYIEVGTLRTHNDGKGFRKVSDGLCSTIPARAREDGSGQPIIREPVGFAHSSSGREWGRESRIKEGEANSLLCGKGCDGQSTMTRVSEQGRIRRLTPVECERLQGFPDNWTKYGHDGKEISDTQRYKMCGNAVSVPVVKAVGEAITKDAWE